MSLQLLRLPQVLERTALKRSQLYRLIKSGNFPKQIKLSERCCAWDAGSVDAWIESRKAA